MTGFFIALLSGALMSVQGVFNTQVTKTTGMWVSNAWVQLSAFAICLVMWLIMGRDSIATIGEVQPKYMLLGGVIGAGITCDRDQKYGAARACKGGTSDRYVSAYCSVSD